MKELENRSDFHAHITSEEDALTLIDKAIEANVKSIALIGRGVLPDNTDSIISKAQDHELDLYFGVEDIFNINGQRKDFIILNINPNNQEIKDLYSHDKIRGSSLKVLDKQIAFLEARGFRVWAHDEDSETMLEKLRAGEIYEKAITLCRIVCSNPENDEVLERLWAVYGRTFADQYSNSSFDLSGPSPKFVWWLYFAVGKPGYFNNERSPRHVAKVAHEAGGLLIFSPESEDPNSEIIKVLDGREYIDGVMGWHGDKFSLSRDTVRWLRVRGKVIFGGSDYNPLREGEEGQWLVGIGKGEMFISPKRYERELRIRR